MSESPQSAQPFFSLPGFDADNEQASFEVPKPPWWRRRGILITSALLLALLVGGSVFAAVQTHKKSVTYQYQRVTEGNFSLIVNATGPVQSGTYNVEFSGTGKITEIDVKVGQTVRQGQVLAKLDKTSLQDAVDAAQASLLAALSSLNNAQNSAGKTAAQGTANIAAAQTALKNAQMIFTTTQSQSTANVTAAQTALSNAFSNLTVVQGQAQASIGEAEAALRGAEMSLFYTQQQTQASVSAAQTTLSNALNNLSHVRTDSQKSVTLARQQEQQAINQCNNAATPTPNCVQVAQAQYNQAVAQANTNIASAQATVNNDQHQMQLAQAQAASDLATAQSQVTTDEKQLSVAQANAAAQNNTAQGQINTAEGQLTTAEANSASQDTSAQAQVNTAQSQLTTAEANAATQNATAQGQVTTAQAQFNTAQVQLQTAQHNLENAILKAPHEGVVSLINGTVGGNPGVPANSNVSAATPGSTFVQIVDLSTLQVQANVNESDTGNLHVGQPVQFTVSAFGEKLFRGTVSAIAPNGETISNVVTYPVTIDVDMNSLRSSTLLPGMTANVTITVVRHPNVLLLPVNAVNVARTASTLTNDNAVLISKDVEASALAQARQMLRELQMEHPDGSADNAIPALVLEHSGNQFIVKPVVLGLTDDTVYEVLAGLSADETILVGIQRGN